MRPKGLREYHQRKNAGRSDAGSSARRPPVQKPRGHLPSALLVAGMKARFLLLYSRTGLLTKSCEALKWPDGRPLSRDQIYAWAKRDPLFAAAFTNAKVAFGESLEEEAHRRAVIGVKKPIYFKGEVVGEVNEYSDQLLVTLLKANLPDKYRERIDISLDVRREIERMATEMGVPLELAEAEWAALEPALLGKGS